MLKNKTVATLLVTSLLAGVTGTIPTNVFAKEVPKDLTLIKTEAAKQAVKYLFEKDKLNGYVDNTFKPENDITRAEFITMVLNSLNLDEKKDAKTVVFKDSVPGNWHYENLKKAHSYGLLSGNGVDKNGAIIMSPNDKITREEMVTILVRAHEQQFGTVTITQTEADAIVAKFKDKDKLPKWSKTSVAKAYKTKITSGVEEDKFGAGDKGTRLQSAVFSYRLLKNVENKGTEETPKEEIPSNPSLLDDVVYLSDSLQTVAGGKTNLVERFNTTADKIHFVKKQNLDDGVTPIATDYKISDVEKLVVVVNSGTKANPTDEYPVKTVYSLKIDSSATGISVDPAKKVVTVTNNDTLKAVKNAFEVTAQAVIGTNEVEFYTEFKDDSLVNGGMTVLLENNEKNISKTLTKFSFADSLKITQVKDSLTVKGLTFEDMLDLHKLNEGTGLWEKVVPKSGAEVKVDGTYQFSGLSLGKYKVVEQPLEITDPVKYAAEYDKRLSNENVYEIVPYLIGELNSDKKIRLVNNYSSFVLTNTNEGANFFKDEVAVADITGSGKLTASIVYDNRLDRANMSGFNFIFGTEGVDVDGDVNTPDVTYQTLELIGTPDYSVFSIGEKFGFTLVLEDKKPDGTVVSKTEVKYEVSVVLNNAQLALEYKIK